MILGDLESLFPYFQMQYLESAVMSQVSGLLSGDVHWDHLINGSFVEILPLKQIFKLDIAYSITYLLILIKCQELAFQYLAHLCEEFLSNQGQS